MFVLLGTDTPKGCGNVCAASHKLETTKQPLPSTSHHRVSKSRYHSTHLSHLVTGRSTRIMILTDLIMYRLRPCRDGRLGGQFRVRLAVQFRLGAQSLSWPWPRRAIADSW